ncbi:MAG TPA: phosphate-starvation-inducible PsiE family protein [Thermoanaerobaculia bacterium]|nr:phosphate-starvation-inducible PsiE family protein [Thermoanaerobaculia bacterium]
MTPPAKESRARVWVARAFSGVEDLVYIGLGLLLGGSAIVLLIGAFMSFGQSLMSGQVTANIIQLLDRILLILLVVELLYTVQVSFREHAVTPEPFLLVGLIAAIRRVLILTAEFGQPGTRSDTLIQHFLLELSVLTLLIVALAVSLFVLRSRDTVSVAKRA